MLDLPFGRYRARKIRIKLEIDVNPPVGSTFTTSYITFPVTAPLTTQSLESGRALKLHALLRRAYVKGHEWSADLFFFHLACLPSDTEELTRGTAIA